MNDYESPSHLHVYSGMPSLICCYTVGAASASPYQPGRPTDNPIHTGSSRTMLLGATLADISSERAVSEKRET